jgi:hypothetical protein
VPPSVQYFLTLLHGLLTVQEVAPQFEFNSLRQQSRRSRNELDEVRHAVRSGFDSGDDSKMSNSVQRLRSGWSSRWQFLMKPKTPFARDAAATRSRSAAIHVDQDHEAAVHAASRRRRAFFSIWSACKNSLASVPMSGRIGSSRSSLSR